MKWLKTNKIIAEDKGIKAGYHFLRVLDFLCVLVPIGNIQSFYKV